MASDRATESLVGINVPARHIPVPRAASKELQFAIATAPGRFVQEWPTSNDGWARLYGDPDKQAREIQKLAARLGVEVRTDEYGGVPCFEIKPSDKAVSSDDPLFLNLHAGGYVMGGALPGALEGILFCAAARETVISVDYRLAPEHSYPAQVDDLLSVWMFLCETGLARRTAMFGTSAGAALILSAVQILIARALPLPYALAITMPSADLTKTGDSYFINDLGTFSYDGGVEVMVRQYAGNIPLNDNRVSPLYGNFAGFPPTILTSGTRDLFLSNTIRVEQKLRAAGRETRLIIVEGLPHCGHLVPDVPEAHMVFSDILRFLAGHFVAREERGPYVT